ncbi:hypothetical protein Tco_1499521 [Tanacetum coccineum]
MTNTLSMCGEGSIYTLCLAQNERMRMEYSVKEEVGREAPPPPPQEREEKKEERISHEIRKTAEEIKKAKREKVRLKRREVRKVKKRTNRLREQKQGRVGYRLRLRDLDLEPSSFDSEFLRS